MLVSVAVDVIEGVGVMVGVGVSVIVGVAVGVVTLVRCGCCHKSRSVGCGCDGGG